MNAALPILQETAPAHAFEQWHYDPHHILGLQLLNSTRKVIRLYRPGAQEVYLELLGKTMPAKQVGDAGFFECEVPLETTFADYRIYHQNGHLAHDPYAF